MTHSDRRPNGPRPRGLMTCQTSYEKGRLRIDFASYEVWLDGRPVHLSLRDFELLRFFVRSPNRVYDRSLILKLVWGNETHVTPRTVDVHVRRLRAVCRTRRRQPGIDRHRAWGRLPVQRPRLGIVALPAVWPDRRVTNNSLSCKRPITRRWYRCPSMIIRHDMAPVGAHQYVRRRDARVVTERMLGDWMVNFLYSRTRERSPWLRWTSECGR